MKVSRSFYNIYKARFYYACLCNTAHDINLSPSSLLVRSGLNVVRFHFRPGEVCVSSKSPSMQL